MSEPNDDYVRLDKRTWVRPEHVSMVRLGLDYETLIHLGDSGIGWSVDLSITETLTALSGSRALKPPGQDSQQEGSDA